MLIDDDVTYQVLLWLPVISLLRFKLVCKTWRALVESNDFVKQHLYHHYNDPNLKDKNHHLIHLVTDNGSPFTFPLNSIGSFEEPNACVQLDCSELREYFPLTVADIASFNGIVCLNLFNRKMKQCICLWNPATKQSRVLPRSHAPRLETEHNALLTMVGFGFDYKNSEYKVVNFGGSLYNNEERVELYSLTTDSWRSVTVVFPFRSWLRNPRIPFNRIPFNNGTCFFWDVWNSGSRMILCFDFSSEKIRSVSFPNFSNSLSEYHASVLNDKIACVSYGFDCETEIWVFYEYGHVNESWVKLYTIDLHSTIDWRMPMELLSLSGNYLFYIAKGYDICRSDVIGKMVCGYNVVTKEIKNMPTVKIGNETSSKDWRCFGLKSRYYTVPLLEFKESLLSVGNNQSATHYSKST